MGFVVGDWGDVVLFVVDVVIEVVVWFGGVVYLLCLDFEVVLVFWCGGGGGGGGGYLCGDWCGDC